MVNVFPIHSPIAVEIGVTVYTTCWVVFVVFCSVCDIEVAGTKLSEAPVIKVDPKTVQVYSVVVGTISVAFIPPPFVGNTSKLSSEQMTTCTLSITGISPTFTNAHSEGIGSHPPSAKVNTAK